MNKEQPELFEEQSGTGKQTGPVTCLGMTFENDAARRAYFLEKLREKLQDPAFRKIEGFPLGRDEDILALSDPPYYTACPNPFMEEFIRQYGKPYDPGVPYRREPFAADVSEGKNDPIYNAHSYHTKVPHKAIMRYILHYTEPGDVVFDGFCGTGMTGVAAQLCGDKATVESLGYRVLEDGTILNQEGKPFSKLGIRNVILNDLSPAATFIAYNYNTPIDLTEFEKEANRILKEVEAECGWMYETLHSDGETKGRVNYTIWSDVYICPECSKELVFWEVGVDKEAGEVREEFSCIYCNAKLTKRNLEHAIVNRFDKELNQTIRQAKQVPVLIIYNIDSKRYEKIPDEFDFKLIEEIESRRIPCWFPTDEMPEGYNTEQPKISHGITHANHFYTKRNLWTLGVLHKYINGNNRMLFLLSGIINRSTKMNRIHLRYFTFGGGGWNAGYLKGTLYVSSLPIETSIFEQVSNRLQTYKKAFVDLSKLNLKYILETNSLTKKYPIDNSVDYIFTDPPFGGNLMYSELNFLWEAWLKIYTNSKPEAIENLIQNKGLSEYQRLMTECFHEYYRVLKPGRWITIEFHNSKNSVWNAIQEALQNEGFVIADVRILDKKQGSFKQVTTVSAVKQDLIISAYKPNGGLEERFKLEAGTEEGVWDFIRTHLRQLPIIVVKKNHAEVIAERKNYLLFDRMVAFHVKRGVTVPLTAAEFYQGLIKRFPERDGMYFLPDQVAEYDKARLTVREVEQLKLFVSDEASAIHWLRQQITMKPQTAGELKPQFMQEIGGWQKNEKMLELDEILEQNFLCYHGIDEVPSQIHSYLSTNFKELRNLPKDDPLLRAKAKGRWYVPDPNKAVDLEKIRERALLREFEEYRESKQRKLKLFRLEAVRAGFKKAFQEQNYQIIIDVASKIPDNILHEDTKLLMWYDLAVMRLEERK
ncbi:MAG: site-specific DNA-methyltransferase [Firmicutes bacterium]|nr:site-specific DNA-methyltransferase [Bacillota bacterium]